MKTVCIECHEEINATETLQRHKCGIYYGLTPYFPFDDVFLKKKNRHIVLKQERY